MSKLSKKWALNLRDYAHGVLMTIAGTMVTGISTILQTGTIPTEADIKKSASVGVGVGLAYLFKKLSENSNGQITKGEK